MTWIIAVARWLFALFYTYVDASWLSYKLFGTAWPDHKEAPAAPTQANRTPVVPSHARQGPHR
jgi:hypothetical protein